MNLLESFYISLDEKKVWWIITGSQKLWTISVNNSYSISKGGDSQRTFASLGLQESISTGVKFQRKRNTSIKTPVLINLSFNQIVASNLDGSPNRASALDVDNPLKHVIDSITNSGSIKDDNIVYWIIAKRELNAKDFTFFDIKIFDFKPTEFNLQRENIEKKYKKEFNHRIYIPSKLKIPSFNASYETVSAGSKKDKYGMDKEQFKKILKNDVKIYKEFISNEIKKHLEINYPEFKLLKGKDLVIDIRFGIKNIEWRDLDNMFKSNIDSLTKVIYFDDKWIDTIIATKEIATNQDFVEFTIYSKN